MQLPTNHGRPDHGSPSSWKSNDGKKTSWPPVRRYGRKDPGPGIDAAAPSTAIPFPPQSRLALLLLL